MTIGNTHGPGRGPRRAGFIRTPESVERTAQACKMRSRGHSYTEISNALGYGGESNARTDVERAMVQTITEPADEARLFELNRLDEMTRVAFDILESQNYVVSDGRIVRDAEGAALLDPEVALKALDRLLKISERKAKLNGWDAPKRTETTIEHLQSWVVALEGELGVASHEPVRGTLTVDSSSLGIGDGA